MIWGFKVYGAGYLSICFIFIKFCVSVFGNSCFAFSIRVINCIWSFQRDSSRYIRPRWRSSMAYVTAWGLRFDSRFGPNISMIWKYWIRNLCTINIILTNSEFLQLFSTYSTNFHFLIEGLAWIILYLLKFQIFLVWYNWAFLRNSYENLEIFFFDGLIRLS